MAGQLEFPVFIGLHHIQSIGDRYARKHFLSPVIAMVSIIIDKNMSGILRSYTVYIASHSNSKNTDVS